MVVLLYNKTSGSQTITGKDFNIVQIGKTISEDYYSITFKGKKIGYSSVIKQKTPTGFLFQESSFYRLPVGGVYQEVTSQGLLSVDESLWTQVVNFSYSTGGYQTQVNAAAKKNILDVEIITPSGERRASFPLSGRIYSSTVIPEFLASRKFPRTIFNMLTFDPLTLCERTFEVRVIGPDKIKRFGDRSVTEVRVSYGGLYSSMFIDTAGILIMEKTPEGFMSVREDKATALRLDIKEGGSTDILSDFAIPLGGAVINNPRDAISLVIRIDNLPGELFELDDFNQRWVPESLLLIIRSYGFKPDSGSSFKWLPSDTIGTLDIESHDRRIISAAKKITAGAADDSSRLVMINEYLFKNIKKGYVSSIPSAVDVLSKMRGDCNEHAVLFTALARALGIPTRTNIGLLYKDGDFYYHAWIQAFANGRWISFDPTLGQSPVDAAHIKLASGGLDRALVLLRIGDARLKLVSVEYRNGSVYKVEEVSNPIKKARK